MNPVGKLILWLSGFLLLWATVLSVDTARGHDAGGWHYPSICCHDADCAPVEREGEDTNGERAVSTKLHAGITTKADVYTYKMPSPDGKTHICATPDKDMAPNMTRHYYCIFQPAGM